MRVCFSAGYMMPLPAGHRFPMGKYGALHDILIREGVIREADIVEPEEAAYDDLRMVHTEEYLADLANGTLSPAAVRRLGLPWSPALVRRARLAVNGTRRAAELALEDGIAGNLAGGTHHAFADRGEGFCTLNDVAVTIRTLQRDGRICRALIVDLDVHQGNGTASIFAGDAAVFTFSMHGQKNYPFHKEVSSLDVGLPDGTADAAFLDALAANLPAAFAAAKPDLVFYLAGVDVVRGDRFGRLALSRDGLHARDRYVLRYLRERHVPLTLVLSGGYAATPQATADLHATVHREALAMRHR